MSYKIVIDLSHGEEIESFPDAFDEDDYMVSFIDKNKGPITFKKLDDYDLLIIGNIRHTEKGKDDKFSRDELKSIKEFVGKGGGLLVVSGAGGDNDIPINQGSIRVLYKLTGVKRYWNGVVMYPKKKSIIDRVNLKIETIFTHPITQGINRLVLGECTFFSITEDAEDIVTTSENAAFKYESIDEVDEIGQVPLCVVSEFFSGRVVTLGSSSLFQEESEIGLDIEDNSKFLENIIKWLCFDLEELIIEEDALKVVDEEEEEEEEEETDEADLFE